MEASGQLHVPAALLPEKDPPPRYPLDRWLGGPQSWSGHDIEEEDSQPSPGFESRPSDRPARKVKQSKGCLRTGC
jgi:hypothetical protein